MRKMEINNNKPYIYCTNDKEGEYILCCDAHNYWKKNDVWIQVTDQFVARQFVAAFACCVLRWWGIWFCSKFKCLCCLYRYSGIRGIKMRNRQRRMISERDRVKEEIATDGGRQRAGTWGRPGRERRSTERDREERGRGEKETGERDRREGEQDRSEREER